MILFQLDISGIDIRFEHLENICLISLTFSVFQTDISGKDIKFEHPEKIPLKLVILPFLPKFSIPVKDIKELQF